MEIIEMLAYKGTACRPAIPLLGFLGITVHNTSNWSKGANAINHANYLRNGGANKQVSWHYVIDKDRAVRCIPENETAWCAGDGGNGNGNRKTINIEICDNADGDIRKATDNAVELCSIILRNHGITNASGHLFQHNHWTGKDCPYDIRRGNPYDWNTFVSKVQEKLNGNNNNTTQPVSKPATNNSGFLYANYNGSSIVDALKGIGVDSSFNHRKQLASLNGISNYTGTPSQNTQLLNLLKQGKLKANGTSNTNTSTTSNTNNTAYLKANYSGSSLVDALKGIGVDSSFAYRSKLAYANGIRNYKGTPLQNTTLLNLLKQGRLKKV